MLIHCSECGMQWDTELAFCGAFYEGCPLCPDCITGLNQAFRVVDPMRGEMSVETWLEFTGTE